MCCAEEINPEFFHFDLKNQLLLLFITDIRLLFGISGSPRPEAPKIMWPLLSREEMVLKGQTARMKCIFSG